MEKQLFKKKIDLILQVKSSALCSLLLGCELKHNKNEAFPRAGLSIPHAADSSSGIL